MLTGSTG
ncbi:rCG27814, isoform CRA_d [Rattus norvegicus]|nr:rCG27814, isoform CRA_d [Rattus norvegicus]